MHRNAGSFTRRSDTRRAGAGAGKAAAPGSAQKLFLEAHRRDLRRMIFIAVSLTVALVAADLLELGSRRRDRA
ncbi:hypothetical protein [Sorangium sp. So ce1097]|uniref:hypothetical protein n=1 Tax=Sorangium sp. So ce1097 TaxID=3133330 RepID=UPI003F62EBBF